MKPNFLVSLRNGLAVMALTLFTGFLAAQPAPPASADQILQRTNTETDGSIKILKMIFGDSFVANPLTALGADTSGSLLASMFVIFNICIFAVGLIWLSYTIAAGVAQTAHEGEALGRRFSSLWLPIRIVTGIAGIVPVFSGFSAFQALLMFLGLVGIGVANWIWTSTIDSSSRNFQGLTQMSATMPRANVSLETAYKGMFITHVCSTLFDAYGRTRSAGGEGVHAAAGDETTIIRYPTANPSYGATYGNQNDKALCGSWVVKEAYTPNAANSDRRDDDLPTLAFRVNSVDYSRVQAYAVAASNAYKNEVLRAEGQIQRMARDWVIDRDGKLNTITSSPSEMLARFPLQELKTLAKESETNISRSVISSNGGTKAITDTAQKNMMAYGWVGAGAWFSTFAEANAALADSVKNISFGIALPKSNSAQFDSYIAEGLRALKMSIDNTEIEDPQKATSGDDSAGFWRKVANSVVDDSSTGNLSVGQGMTRAMMRGLANDSGGAGLINPIIMFKNAGDYVLTATSVVLGAQALGKVVEWFPATKAWKLTGWAANPIANAASKAESGKGLLADTFSGLAAIAMLMLVAGLIMSIYLPFVPFIVWIGGLVTYFTIFVEGIMAAPIWAFTHLDSNGDGMGQRTERGYLFALNMLMRPALMVMSFFVASGLMIGIGTLTAALFLPAMSNVQGNSVTGLLSIAGLLLVFFVINVTLIHGLFNLIFIIPDQVLNMVGGANGVTLGREVDDKVRGIFLAGGGTLRGFLGGGGDKDKKPKTGGGGAGDAVKRPDPQPPRNGA